MTQITQSRMLTYFREITLNKKIVNRHHRQTGTEILSLSLILIVRKCCIYGWPWSSRDPLISACIIIFHNAKYGDLEASA